VQQDHIVQPVVSLLLTALLDHTVLEDRFLIPNVQNILLGSPPKLNMRDIVTNVLLGSSVIVSDLQPPLVLSARLEISVLLELQL